MNTIERIQARIALAVHEAKAKSDVEVSRAVYAELDRCFADGLLSREPEYKLGKVVIYARGDVRALDLSFSITRGTE
jgi:hypothetical protein